MIQTNADQIIHSKRSTFLVEIKRNGSLSVRVPEGSSVEAIQKAIDSKMRWILKKRAEIYKLDISAHPKKFVDGENFLYLGVVYPLSVDGADGAQLVFDGKRFVLSKEHQSNARDVFVEWYRECAQRHISERVQRYSRQYNIPFQQDMHHQCGEAMGLVQQQREPALQLAAGHGAAGCDRLRYHP